LMRGFSNLRGSEPGAVATGPGHCRLSIVDCQFPLRHYAFGNRKLEIGNDLARSLPLPVLTRFRALQKYLQLSLTSHILAGLTCPLLLKKVRQVETRQAIARVACLPFFEEANEVIRFVVPLRRLNLGIPAAILRLTNCRFYFGNLARFGSLIC